MRVLLIYPLPRMVNQPGPHWIPLGLSYIAAALRRGGHAVSIYDRFAAAGLLSPHREMINAGMMERLRSFKPDLVGFNTVTPLIYDTAECAALVRNRFDGLLLAGGHHATALPELTLRNIPQLDGVVQGEGENALLRLAEGENPAHIQGVWWKNNERVGGSAPEQIPDLDCLPFPAFDLLEMPFYIQRGRNAIKGHHLSTAALITSRGCTRRCDFCSEALTYGPGVRRHSPGYVLEMIRRVLTDYPVEAIYFHDNDFLSDGERAAAICERLIDTGLHRRVKFSIQTRVSRLNPDILGLLKRAGCTLVEMGIETASQAELDSVHKGTTVELNERAVEMCRQAGLAVHAYMLTGFAGETGADLEARRRWLKGSPGNLSFSMSMLQLYPGTRLYRERGASFFEHNRWTGEAVSAFYQKDHLSAVPAAERKTWMEHKFLPLQKWRNRTALLRRNPPLAIGRIVLDKAARLWRRPGRGNTPRAAGLHSGRDRKPIQ